jgi:hypothetical protein
LNQTALAKEEKIKLLEQKLAMNSAKIRTESSKMRGSKVSDERVQ